MNAARARRRWMAWCRYVDKTQTHANRSRGWGTDTHTGQAVAYWDASFARRYPPRGMRAVYYPRWGTARG